MQLHVNKSACIIMSLPNKENGTFISTQNIDNVALEL